MEIMKIRGWPVAMVGILLSACAAPPQKPTPIAVAAPAASPKSIGSDALQPTDVEKKSREMGYHVEIQNGQRGYCRNTAPTGSHISRKECLSPAAMAQAVQTAEDIQNQISQRNGQACTGCARD
jgi:hypothetical protein